MSPQTKKRPSTKKSGGAKKTAAKKPAAKKSAAKTKSAAAKPRSIAAAEQHAAARSPSWQGAISFGLIHFPVAIYGVTTNRRIDFRQLHDEDGGRIKQQRVCSIDGEVVPFEHIVKGYEIAKDEYVVIEPNDLAALDPERSTALELEKFIDAEDVDPLIHDRNFYVMPAKGADTPYALLRDAMAAEDKAAVAKLVMHGKEHLVSLWPHDDVLVLSTLHFEEEIADPVDLPGRGAPQKSAADNELDAARKLVQALSGRFKLSDYHDEHRDAVLALIDAKARGRKVKSAPPAEPKRQPTTDLMSALEESLASIRGGKPASSAPRRRGSGGSHKTKSKAH